jgi:hypothetical protein
VLSALIGLVLRFPFGLKGKWLAVIVVGFLPPMFLAPLSIYSSLVAVGTAPQNSESSSRAVSIFASNLEIGLSIAGLWFCLGIVAFFAAIWLPRPK